ncbi:hypothetical protein ABH924_003313 [Arthrobacter sp. GAS37]|uniref:SAF domain-containing protein n=1 Tax=Arthrobacter sp. GAS37 TaxID=3156261 RepID=UPI003832ADD8
MTITERLRGTAPSREPRDKKKPAGDQHPPVKRRVRTIWLIAGALLVVIGASATFNLVNSAGSTVSVLVTSADIKAGQKLSGASGLQVTNIEIAAGQQTDAYRADQAKDLADKVAATDLPQGSLITPRSITGSLTPATGESIVGVSLKPEHTPARPFAAGDAVRIIDSGANAQGTNTTRGQDIPGKVLAVRTDPTTQSTIVDIVVKEGIASEAAARAARGVAVLVVDSPTGGKGN